MEVELTWILAGRQDVNSSVEGEPDEHEVGKLRMLDNTWNRCCWENVNSESPAETGYYQFVVEITNLFSRLSLAPLGSWQLENMYSKGFKVPVKHPPSGRVEDPG